MSNLQIIISMKRLKLPTYKIFSFEGLDLDSLYETHLSLNYTKAIEHDDNAVVKSIIKQVEGTIPIDNNKPIPRKKELIEKYQYFIHLLITRSFMKGYNTFNSEFLQDLFGSSYRLMIMTLIHLGHISRSPIYEIGKSARTITLINENIICRTKYDSSFEKYSDKHLALMKSEQKRKIDSISKEIGVDFLNQYKRNVRKLKIVDETSARLFIDNNTATSNYQKQSYQWMIDKYINKEFEISTDNDNRIYSVLTYTHKDLKNFINIKYQLDINNSHPLLFSYYIIMKYNIFQEVGPNNQNKAKMAADYQNKIRSNLDDEIYHSLKRLLLETKSTTMFHKKLNVRFISSDKMFKFPITSSSNFPFGESVGKMPSLIEILIYKFY